MEPDARRIILARIRNALLPSKTAHGTPEDSWAAIPRDYRRAGDAPASAVLDLFTHRLRDYDAQVLRCLRADAAPSIARMLRARGAARILVPSGFPEALLPAGFVYVRDAQLSIRELDECEGVMTLCTLAIAETGTIILQNAPGQGRRAASLVPDYHLCLVDAAQVVATVPEAIAALKPTATLPTTFVSGPSATADIEMTRIKGVHGPRFLDVILILPPA